LQEKVDFRLLSDDVAQTELLISAKTEKTKYTKSKWWVW